TVLTEARKGRPSIKNALGPSRGERYSTTEDLGGGIAELEAHRKGAEERVRITGMIYLDVTRRSRAFVERGDTRP
ncbi:MAG: hypothetical protein M3P49_16715, partial [Actinomycetota bacterium]|nr:hypothetical protein [Actinomycetota bacterium]